MKFGKVEVCFSFPALLSGDQAPATSLSITHETAGRWEESTSCQRSSASCTNAKMWCLASLRHSRLLKSQRRLKLPSQKDYRTWSRRRKALQTHSSEKVTINSFTNSKSYFVHNHRNIIFKLGIHRRSAALLHWFLTPECTNCCKSLPRKESTESPQLNRLRTWLHRQRSSLTSQCERTAV